MSVEILVHATAPSLVRDDNRYRRIVDACLALESEDEYDEGEGEGEVEGEAPVDGGDGDRERWMKRMEFLVTPTDDDATKKDGGMRSGTISTSLSSMEDAVVPMTEKSQESGSWNGTYVFPESTGSGPASYPDSIPDSQDVVLREKALDETAKGGKDGGNATAVGHEYSPSVRAVDRTPSQPRTPSPVHSSSHPDSHTLLPFPQSLAAAVNCKSESLSTTSGSYFDRLPNSTKYIPSLPPPPPSILSRLPTKTASQLSHTPSLTSPDRLLPSKSLREFRALPKTLGELFPDSPFLELHSPEPEVGSNPALISAQLKGMEGSAAFEAFAVKKQVREVREWERGYWKVECGGWEEGSKKTFWRDLKCALEKGRLGFVEVFPDLEVVEDERDAGGEGNRRRRHGGDAERMRQRCDAVRVFCFGGAARHIWATILAFSLGQSKSGMQWIDASGNPIIFC